MADKKSILEEALLDIKNIQSALNANTKEILRSVAREEIDGVVKESLTKEVYEEEEVASVNEESHEESEAPTGKKKENGKGSEKKGKTDAKKMTEGMGLEGMDTEDMDTEDLDTQDMGAEGMDAEGMGDEGMGDEGMGYENGMDGLGSSEELDMTAASDDDVIAIYKKLSGEDEIEIVGDEIHLNVSEPRQYIIKTSDLETAPEMGTGMGIGMDDEESDVDYEIEMDDEEGGEAPADLVSVDDEGGEEPIEEKISIGTGMSVGTHRSKTGAGSIGASENPKSITESAKRLVSETTKKYNLLLTETKKLKSENEQFRGALREFRTKLVETVVFNSNLTYVTKLFTEHATTKGEKQNIIKRFDEQVSNLKDSKKLYRIIANELESRKPISESVENKIIKEATTSSSKQLNESTAYVDPSTKRILDLINRVENNKITK